MRNGRQASFIRRRRLIALLAALLLVHGIAAAWLRSRAKPPDSIVIDFQQYRFGVPPGEFDYEATGPSGPALTAGRPYWRAYVDRFAPSPQFALIQAAASGRDDDYPLALLRGIETADVTAAVHLKPMGGERRQSAGLLWRAHDRNNYYAALASASDDRVHLVKVVGGRATEIASAPIRIDVEFERREPTPGWGWYALRVRAVGDRIAVWFQDAKAIDARDGTFAEPGRVGLVTHGDTVALFDDLHVQPGSAEYVPLRRQVPARAPAPVMRVADIFTYDPARRGVPEGFARGDTVYWKVRIADAGDRPVPAATVSMTLEDPAGAVTPVGPRMAGSDGTAWFTVALDRSAAPGTYRLRVANVAHADAGDAVYDASANAKTTMSFSVR